MNADVARADGDDGAPSAVEFVQQPPATPSVGQQLRAEREVQGMSISDVAQRLKFAPRQIEAVEADNFKALPGLTFVRGFVRGYAKLLNMDASPLVTLLERSAGQDGGPTTAQLQSISPTRAQFPAHTASHSAAWPWLLAILVAIVGIGGYSIYHWQAPSEAMPSLETRGAAQAPEQVQPPAIAPPSSSAETAQGAAIAPFVAPAQDAPSAPPAPAAAPVATLPMPEALQGKIRLVFSGESWTEIRDSGGKIVYSGKGNAGTVQWADGEPPFDLVVGNARETRLFYRGSEVDLAPYIKGSVARIQLK